MHIPDGFLDIKSCVGAGILSVGSISFVVKELKKNISDKDIPQMGVVSAFIFAAQMINFPIAFGTSGHLLGAALATILLGPLKAIIVLTGVVGVQAFFFQDGGIMAIGANLLNIAILPVVIVYLAQRFLSKIDGFEKSKIFIVSWISVVISAVIISLELQISGTYELGKVLTLMFFWHCIIGIGEGIITCLSYSFINNLLERRNLNGVES
ncbi:energy-coupling factor ABC transporter permease [Clostridium sediminicola]|uniref:energy-coupling factor ABC transporter permease n=1 Tax=Clostridium sediminicola TaxID=3114879 RepID=UPI0031F1FE9D